MVPLIVVFLIGRGSDSLWPYVLGVGLTIALIGTFPMRLGMSVGADYLISCHSGNYGQTSNPAAGDPSDPA